MRNPYTECRRLSMRGVIWLTISSLLFGLMAVLVRLAGLRGIPGSESTLVRFLFGLLAVGVLHFGGIARVRLHRLGWLAARGITGGIAILLYFLSLSAATGPESVPLTNSVFLGNSYFVYAPIFAALLLRERVRPATALMVSVALIGLYLVANPNFSSLRSGNVYGFLAGIMSALALVAVRELRRTERAITIFFSLCVFGALTALLLIPFQHRKMPDPVGWLILLLIGVLATAAQMSLTYALKYVEVGRGSIIQMTAVIYSSLAGILWLGDPFDARVGIGAFLVLASAAYISVSEGGETCE